MLKILVKQLAGIIRLPDLLTLSAMKAFALGQRAKWKDYIDLYFILKKHFSIGDIITKAKKIFRIQLGYFQDVDYSEEVIWLKGFETSDKIIKRSLINFSLS